MNNVFFFGRGGGGMQDGGIDITTSLEECR